MYWHSLLALLALHLLPGASELIDLVIRNANPGRWRPGPQRTQYKEYARSALAAGEKAVVAVAATTSSMRRFEFCCEGKTPRPPSTTARPEMLASNLASCVIDGQAGGQEPHRAKDLAASPPRHSTPCFTTSVVASCVPPPSPSHPLSWITSPTSLCALRLSSSNARFWLERASSK